MRHVRLRLDVSIAGDPRIRLHSDDREILNAICLFTPFRSLIGTGSFENQNFDVRNFHATLMKRNTKQTKNNETNENVQAFRLFRYFSFVSCYSSKISSPIT